MEYSKRPIKTTKYYKFDKQYIIEQKYFLKNCK